MSAKNIWWLVVILLLANLSVWKFIYFGLRDYKLEPVVGKSAEIVGVISDEPDERETNIHLTISIPDTREKILVIVPRGGDYHYGEQIKVNGKLDRPESFETDNGTIFDYPEYLAKDNIYYVVRFAEIEEIRKGQGIGIRGWLFNLKEKWLESVNKLIPEPAAALAGGLTVGAKRGLGAEWQDIFRRAGLSHIVVLSGYNLTIVATAVMAVATSFFAFLPSLIIGAVSILLFALMTGGGATVVRASAMALLALFARATGRLYDASRALIIVGLVMVAWNPKILIWDVSFQLSFLATAGLIWISPKLEPKLGWIRPKWVREIVITTTAAQIAVAPWILHVMGNFSFVAIPVNVLVLLTVPAAMLFSFLAGVIGWLSYWLAFPIALIAHLILSYQLIIAKFFADLPLAAWEGAVLPSWAAIIIYIIYLYAFWPKTPVVGNRSTSGL